MQAIIDLFAHSNFLNMPEFSCLVTLSLRHKNREHLQRQNLNQRERDFIHYGQ